jgi:hypothetical protein
MQLCCPNLRADAVTTPSPDREETLWEPPADAELGDREEEGMNEEGMNEVEEAAAPERFDVVIFEIETREVDTIAGANLPADGNGENARRRVRTVEPRLNDRYAVTAVPAGAYAVGDIMGRHDANTSALS